MTRKRLIGYDIDDVLELVGLARRRHMLLEGLLPMMGLLAVGAAVGAGVGLMLAPSSGRRLRKEVGDKLDDIRSRMRHDVERTKGEVQQRVTDVMNATQQSR
jgi:hypothetical protein